MSRKHHLSKWIRAAALFILMGGAVSCRSEAETGPQAWIDSPHDGVSVPSGTPLTVISHAYAREGVAEVLLSVDGIAYRRDAPAEAGVPFAEFRQEWVPPEDGHYVLQVTTYDTTGAASNPATVSVRVGEEIAEVPTEVPPPTEVRPTEPPAEAPDPTAVPPTAVPPTAVPPTAVPPTEPPPTAAPPTAVPPTEPPPPTEVPPTAVPPTEVPPDTTPPDAPTPFVPADGLVVECRTDQNLVWLPVDDPSDVTYYVKLEKQIKVDEWQAEAGYGPLTDKQVRVDVDCGLIYRWAVRAQDGAGNFSDWSQWFQFSVELE